MHFDFKKECGALWGDVCARLRKYLASPEVKRGMARIVCAVVSVLLVLWIINSAFLAPPINAVAPIIIGIDSTQTLTDISIKLQQERIIKYAKVLRVVVRIIGGERHIQSGAYLFSEPQNVITVAVRLSLGKHDVAPVRVVVQEGSTVHEIGDLLVRKLAPFNLERFLTDASTREGFLYPDTYYFYPAQNPDEVERAMEQNFYRKLATAQDIIQASGRSLPDLITMASIVAGEARTTDDRVKVASILWKRLSIGMPLQVDSPFGYVMEKQLTQLTHTDIATDSPYNTYTNKGLPPTPISSPTILAIIAVATPTTTPFLFYMSDAKGVMHYSETFPQHRMLVQKYL